MGIYIDKNYLFRSYKHNKHMCNRDSHLVQIVGVYLKNKHERLENLELKKVQTVNKHKYV